MSTRGQGRGFTLIELMVTVAIIGVLAATAIPAFMQYTKKAKTAEARQNLKRIYDGARSYYMDPGPADVTGMQNQAMTFPMGAPAAPPWASCCGAGGASTPEKCEPEASYWEVPGWKALHFGMSDPHYYQYEYSYYTGVFGYEQAFITRAWGDLDCDAVRSTFMMSGGVDIEQWGNVPMGTGKIVRVNEWE